MGMFFHYSVWECGQTHLKHMGCRLTTWYLKRIGVFLWEMMVTWALIYWISNRQYVPLYTLAAKYWRDVYMQNKSLILWFICSPHSNFQGVSFSNLPSFHNVAYVHMSACWRWAFPFWLYGKVKTYWKLLSFSWQVN
jgi:hypothetical protein